MTNDQIKHMVERFLGWRLPENFNPDGGISFEPYGNKGTEHEYKREPSGTNILDATQAEEMVRYMVDGLPSRERQPVAESERPSIPKFASADEPGGEHEHHFTCRTCGMVLAESERSREGQLVEGHDTPPRDGSRWEIYCDGEMICDLESYVAKLKQQWVADRSHAENRDVIKNVIAQKLLSEIALRAVLKAVSESRQP